MGHFCVSLAVALAAGVITTAVPAAADCPRPEDTTRLARPVDRLAGAGFGPQRHPILGFVRPHDGLDFPAPSGTEVRAAAAGRITVSERRGEFGNLIVVDHGAGLETSYGHLSRFRAGTGDCLAAGEVLGYVGNTGLSAGPHLHFEVRRHGVAFDPELFLPRSAH